MHEDRCLTGEAFFSVCKGIDTPISLGAWLRYKYDHSSYLQMQFNPRDHMDATAARSAYLVYSYLRKSRSLKTNIDLDAVAIQSFTNSEKACSLANERLLRSRASALDADLASILHGARRKIARILGPFSWEKVFPYGGWGNGATFDVSRSRAFLDVKMCELPLSVTNEARGLAACIIKRDLHWSAAILGVTPSGDFSFLPKVFSPVQGSALDSVPKSAKTNRLIAKEPTLNGYLQKQFGNYIRLRLRRFGVNLNDQSVNQTLACQALERGLSTIDLEAASDTICKELVFELLPIDWACALDTCRAKKIRMFDGSWLSLEKFSSMGNGFTFELESLIFYGLVSAVEDFHSTGFNPGVYGDDIVCSGVCFDTVEKVLSFCGFSLNREKSFKDGPFFESCGKHYFLGCDITPCYQKVEATSEFELIRAHNRLYRWGLRWCPEDTIARNAANVYRRHSRLRNTCMLPEHAEGDDGFLSPGPFKQKDGYAVCKVVRRRKKKPMPAMPEPLYADWLRARQLTRRADSRVPFPFQALVLLKGREALGSFLDGLPAEPLRSITSDRPNWDDRSDDVAKPEDEDSYLLGTRYVLLT